MVDTQISIESATATGQTTVPGTVPVYFSLSQNRDQMLRKAIDALACLKFNSQEITIENQEQSVFISLTPDLNKGVYQVRPALPSPDSGIDPLPYTPQIRRGALVYAIDKAIPLIPGDRLILKDVEFALPENIQLEDPELYQSFPHLNRPLKETVILNKRKQDSYSGKTTYGSFAALTDVGYSKEEIINITDSDGNSVEITNVQLGRHINQDCIGIATRFDGSSLFVVADGMGGMQDGEIAAYRTTQSITYHYRHGCPIPVAFLLARNELYEYARNLDRSLIGNMATVVCTAEVYRDNLLFHHVGDSRGYLLRAQDGEWSVVYRTADHTDFGKMCEFELPINKQIMNEERVIEWRLNPEPEMRKKYRLYSSPQKYISSNQPMQFPDERIKQDKAFPSSENIQLTNNDILILCSDGLWGGLLEKDILALVEREKTPEAIRDALYKHAISVMEGDSHFIDNLSALVYQHQPNAL